jgi:hypothetical protein
LPEVQVAWLVQFSVVPSPKLHVAVSCTVVLLAIDGSSVIVIRGQGRRSHGDRGRAQNAVESGTCWRVPDAHTSDQSYGA